MMQKKMGYSITTWRLRLYRKHPEWFLATKEIYNSIGYFYLKQIFLHDLQKQTSYILQRKMEILTQGEKRTNTLPICPLPYEKVPLYLRRAALNEAAGLASHTCREMIPEKIDTSPVYYKGMYRNFDMEHRSIELKLYTGKKWVWGRYRFAMDGRKYEEGMEFLSPTIKVEAEQVFLHVPVKRMVKDVRPVKERYGERYLCVAFAMGEIAAGGVALNPGGEATQRAILMIHGGEAFRKRRKKLEEELKDALSDAARAGQTESKRSKECRHKLSELIQREAHRVSREILLFARQEGCRVIVAPDYQGNLGLNWKKWIPYSEYDWLARKCIHYLSYKAFQNGIMLCRVPTKDLSRYCCRCSEELLPARLEESGKLCLCRNGHRQNRILNTAENAGKRYEESNRSDCLPG